MQRPERLRDVNIADLPSGFAPNDLNFAIWLREEANVLHRIEGHNTDLGSAKGAIFTPCSDGERFCDIFDHFRLFWKQGRNGKPLPHTVAQAAVALRLTPDSPVLSWMEGNENDHQVYLNDIEVGILAKGFNFIALCTHWPCGAAIMSKVSFIDSLALFCQSKRAIKERLLPKHPELKVSCFLDLDVGTRQFTYFVSCNLLLEAIERWRALQA